MLLSNFKIALLKNQPFRDNQPFLEGVRVKSISEYSLKSHEWKRMLVHVCVELFAENSKSFIFMVFSCEVSEIWACRQLWNTAYHSIVNSPERENSLYSSAYMHRKRWQCNKQPVRCVKRRDRSSRELSSHSW